MAVGLSIRFDGGTQEQYDAVNAQMGVEGGSARRPDLPRRRPDRRRLGSDRLLGVARALRRFPRRQAWPGDRRARRQGASRAARDQGVPGPQHDQGLGGYGPQPRLDAHRERRARAGEPGDPARRGRAELRRSSTSSPPALPTLLREKGIEPGDRVGVMLPNVPQFPVAYYGVLRAGGVVVPMNVLLKRREIAFYLEDSGTKLLLAWHGFAEEAREGAAEAGAELIEVEPASFAATLGELEPTPGLADTAEDDTAVILYTSGTTGKPKGAELTHANLFRNAEISSRTTCEVAAGDVVLGALPLFHSFGQTVGMNASLQGRRLPHPGAQIRPGRGAGDDAARRRHPLLRRADDVRRAPPPPRARELRHLLAAHLRHRRRLDAGRGAARLRGGLRRDRARGLRPLGDLAGRLLQPPGHGAQAGLDRHPDRGGRDASRRRGRQRRSTRARSARS